MLTLHFYTPERASSVDKAPAWLTDDSAAVPGAIAAGYSLWESLVRTGERLSKPFGLSRPQAWLVEFENQLLLAVGERELGAIDTGSEDKPKRNSFGDRTEQDMVRAIQRLDETLVREVMRPLNNVTAISLANLTSEKFLNVARRTGYTRFPCYYDQVTNLIGYLNVHDFLDSPVLPTDPRKMTHDALFIPELGRLDLVLSEMQRGRQQIAICFDEYGGCSGLLSREDIIEEITGEIMDEYDRPELKVQEAHGAFMVDGTIDLDDLREMLGLDLTSDTFVTLSGYIYHRLSRMPRRGESIEEHDWRIEVAQIEGHRIKKIRLVPPEDADAPRPSTPDSGDKPLP
jgi:CBS domain containing-hemolysin-like protein